MVELTKPEWAGRLMRLDPYHLPHTVSLKQNQHFSYKIDRHGAVMKRQLNCGLPVSIALPQKAFRGVAARTIDRGNGKTTFTLELHHKDCELCLPVLVADDLNDIAADWHAWSRLMRLPMLLIDENSMAVPVRKQLGLLMVETPIERRKRLGMTKNRTWFSRRRKMGTIGPVEKISAAEIIARR